MKKKPSQRMSLIFTALVFAIMFISTFLTGVIAVILLRMGLLYGVSLSEASLVIFVMLGVTTVIGTILTFLLSRAPMRDFHQLIDAIQALGNGDFTKRLSLSNTKAIRDLSESYNKAAAELGSTELLRFDFVNNFSHEFKTPLFSIQGFATLLKNGALTEEDRNHYLDIILAESQRLTTLSTNILTLTALEHQSILSDKQVYALTEQLRTVILLLQPRWEEKNLKLALDLPDCRYCGNADLLEEVWINLLDNAIKFTDPGGTLGVSIFDLGKELKITVSDTGCGMDEETKRHSFHRFYQGDPSRATKGNGMGLSIAARAVELHNGRISIESTPGVGSRFEVYLPKVSLI